MENKTPGDANFVRVGRVKDAHGLKGEIFITLFAGEAAWLKKLKDMRLIKPDGEGLANPNAKSIETKKFEVKSVRAHKNGIIVVSPTIKGRTEAEALKGWLLEIPQDFMVSKKGERLYLAEVKDFAVDVDGKGVIGRVFDFSTNGVQDLLVVKTAAGEFEIPFIKEFVVKIDHKDRVIHMDLPFGLLGEDDDEDAVEPDDDSEDDDE